MKNLLHIILAMTLLVSTASFANETVAVETTAETVQKKKEKSTMDELTNDSAFEYTENLFAHTTGDNTSSGGSLLYGITTIPVAVVESVIWVFVLPFNGIAMAFDDEDNE